MTQVWIEFGETFNDTRRCWSRRAAGGESPLRDLSRCRRPTYLRFSLIAEYVSTRAKRSASPAGRRQDPDELT
jgi:hypothetical protein